MIMRYRSHIEYKNTVSNKLITVLKQLDAIDRTGFDSLKQSAYNHLKFTTIDLLNLYGLHTDIKYDINNVETISNKLQENNLCKDKSKMITLVMTTCKRYDLFTKTINSFLENCNDLDKYITDFVVIDDQSSDDDISKMRKEYPFLTIIKKPIELKGHAKSMNLLSSLITTPYFIILEDDWEFVVKDNYITRCFDILDSDPSLGQALFNLNYAEDFTVGPNIQGSELKTSKTGQLYYLHKFDNKVNYEYPNCHYWPHFSFRVGVTKTEILNKIGKFSEEPIHFEMEYAFRYQQAGYKTAFLNEIVAYHTGRRTYERKDTSKTNAYDLNEERQFGEKLKEKKDDINENKKDDINENKNEDKEEGRTIGSLNGKPIVVKNQYNIKSYVINLERRPQRLYRFFNQLPITNYIHIFDGIDGSKIKPNQKIQQLFSTGDYNYRRGIVGCALSHLSIWQEILSNVNIDYLLIFEDDAILVNDFNTKLLHLISTYHGKFDVLYLGMFPYPNADRKEWHYTRDNIDVLPTARKWSKSEMFSTSMGGNHGYLISRKGVINILNYLDKNGMTNAVDWMVMHSAGTEPNSAWTEPNSAWTEPNSAWTEPNSAGTEPQRNRIFYSEPFIVEGDCYQSSNKTDYQTDIQLDYNSVKMGDEDFFNEELSYWKKLYKDKLIINTDESVDKVHTDKLLDNVVFSRYTDTICIDNKPLKYYKVADWIVTVPEYLLTKEILEEKTFNTFLNKRRFY